MPPPTAKRPMPTGPKKRVLILDDMPLLSRVYCEVLESKGYETEVAGTSDEAWARIQKDEPPARVILAVMVPGTMNGIELCSKIRATERFQRLPIVVLTAKSAEEQARGAGADAFFNKPCKINALIEVVDALTSVT